MVDDTRRSANLALNIREHAQGALQLASLPPVLFIELTQNCNLHCRMCRSAGPVRGDLDMERGLFSRIAQLLFPTATVVDLRGWGESTILSDFDERVAQTVEAGPRIRLVTNALALGATTWGRLMQAGAVVVISIDAATPRTFAELGRGSLAKALASLESGAQARDAAGAGGQIRFNTTLTAPGLSELPEVIRLAARHRVDRITLFPVGVDRDSHLHLQHVRPRIRNVLTTAAALAKELGVELRLGTSIDEEFVVSEALPERCSHPWSYCYIDYAGRVGYCDHLIGHAEYTVGSLLHAEFHDIWNGIEFQQLRNAHLRARPSGGESLHGQFGHCNWCYARRYVDFEDDTHPCSAGHVVSTTHSLPLLSEVPSHCRPSDFLRHTTGT